MRLLFLSPIGGIGGAERVLLTAVAGVRRVEPAAAVRVLALTDGPLVDAVRALGAEADVVPMPAALSRLGDSARGNRRHPAGFVGLARAGVRYVSRLRAAVRRFRPDLVHSNGIKTHLLTRVAVPGGVPVVWHLHDFYGPRPVAGRLLHRAAGRARGGLAVSRAVAADAARVMPGLPIEVLPNAVDLARFGPGPADDLDRLAGMPPADPGTVRVGLVAAYARWKGHFVVLDAAARLAESAPELRVRWYLVGGPIYHTAAQVSAAELRAAAAARGIADRVGFIPFRPDPAGVYRALDVVVHASTQPEPFGLTVTEAMACGRAVIVSAAGGAVELFTDGSDALGVPPGDAPRLSETVRRLVADPTLRDRLGRAARGSVVRFDDRQYGPAFCHFCRHFSSSPAMPSHHTPG